MSILSNFTVVDLIKTRSASVATITGKVLKLNIQTAAELHYAPYIQVLINPKDKQFAIRACKETPPTPCLLQAGARAEVRHQNQFCRRGRSDPQDGRVV